MRGEQCRLGDRQIMDTCMGSTSRTYRLWTGGTQHEASGCTNGSRKVITNEQILNICESTELFSFRLYPNPSPSNPHHLPTPHPPLTTSTPQPCSPPPTALAKPTPCRRERKQPWSRAVRLEVLLTVFPDRCCSSLFKSPTSTLRAVRSQGMAFGARAAFLPTALAKPGALLPGCR